eukprot:g2588.t1
MAEQSDEDESDDYEIISDEYSGAGERPPEGPSRVEFNVAGELCSGTLKKYASGNLMSKWQTRFVRVVSYDTNGKSLILEYAKSQKASLKSDKVHRAHLKAPGIQELSAMGEAPWISKIGGDKTLCCEVFVSKRQHSGGKEHKGGPLVFKFENQRQMEEWKSSIISHFHLNMQDDLGASSTPISATPQPPPPPTPPVAPPQIDEPEEDSGHEDGMSLPGTEASVQPPPPPFTNESKTDQHALGSKMEDDETSSVDINAATNRRGAHSPGPINSSRDARSVNANDRFTNKNSSRDTVQPPSATVPIAEVNLVDHLEDHDLPVNPQGSTHHGIDFDPQIHVKLHGIEAAITDAGLSSTMADIEHLCREAMRLHDASGGNADFVKKEELQSWISKKLAQKDKQMDVEARRLVLPVPRLSDAMERSAAHKRHMTGLDLSASAKMKVEADMSGLNSAHHWKSDIRNMNERPKSHRGRSHTIVMREGLSAANNTALQREVMKMKTGATDSPSASAFSEEQNSNNLDVPRAEDTRDWNERFQSAREMPIDEFQSAMEKGMKLHRLQQKFARLASVATKTIIDEFALPRRLKKIKPLEWLDDTRDAPGFEEGETSDLKIEMEDMPNDLIYQYRSLLIRVLGVSSSREDSETFRKAAGNEVRGNHAFQEACTRVHQDMVARRLEKNGGRLNQIASKDSSSRKGASANGVPILCSPHVMIVDYNGFRVLVSTIPPIDEDHTLAYGRSDPQDPNSNFEDNDPAFSALLSAVAQELNLKEHKIIADAAARLIPLSSEVQGHKCIDHRRYAVNLGRIMPPDLPNGGSDITTKLLRPEFVQAYSMPLSSDAFSSIIMPPQNDSSSKLLDDLSGNDVDAGNASTYLQTKRIPEFVAKLDTLAIFPYESYTLTLAMHEHGINMRYLGRICELTKLPHIRDMANIEMLARTCKDVLNENLRKNIVDAHERVSHILENLAAQGRHLNDEAMAKLLQFNCQLSDDMEANIVDFFNLVLGNSSDHENSLFWKNVLIPRVCEKFQFFHQKVHANDEQGADDPLRIGREVLSPGYLFHAMQYHCGVRFLVSDHYDFNGLASPLKLSHMLESYPKVKSLSNMSLEINRVAAAAEVYRDSGELNMALQAYRLRHDRVKNIDGLASSIPCALAINDIAKTLRLQYHELRKKRSDFGSDSLKSENQLLQSDRERLLQALTYTEEALQLVDSTHIISARIHETRMYIFSDLGKTDELAFEFHTAISATLSHFGRNGMHPYVAELHCILGSLLASHNQISNARKHLELARKLAGRILGPRHPVLASYTVEVARIDMKDDDTFGAFEHYQQALMLVFQTIGRESLEAANILCEMARIKSMHGRQVGQLEAEEALQLAEQALRIRESCAMEEVGAGSHGSDKKGNITARRSNEENLRQKLLSRLDALNKRRGRFQVKNAFSEFRNAAGAQKGIRIDYEGFKRAVRQFDCPGQGSDRLMQQAFSILTRQDGLASTNDNEITFNHVSE